MTMWSHAELREVYRKHGWREADFLTPARAAQPRAPSTTSGQYHPQNTTIHNIQNSTHYCVSLTIEEYSLLCPSVCLHTSYTPLTAFRRLDQAVCLIATFNILLYNIILVSMFGIL